MRLSDYGKPVSIESPEISPDTAKVSEKVAVEAAFEVMLGEKGIVSVEPSAVSVNSWAGYPAGTSTAALYARYYPNATSTYYYCWDSTGKVTRQDESPQPCPEPETLLFPQIPPPTAGQPPAAGVMWEARFSHTATLLQDGRVMVVGGASAAATLASAEVCDTGTDLWAPSAAMSEPREFHTAIALDDGRLR